MIITSLLYNNFNHVIRSTFYAGNKIFKQIQEIIIFTKQSNLANKAMDVTFKAAIILCLARNKRNDRCFFYRQKRYYIK